MVAIDIDGTLVNDHKQIGEKTKAAIKQARKQGVYVVLCTGRPLSGVKDYLEELALVGEDDYAITFNGAKAQITGTGKAIFENLLSPEQVAHLDQVSHELQLRATDRHAKF